MQLFSTAAPVIQVFQLVPAATLLEARDYLQDAILGKGVVVDQSQRVFTVAANSGWMSFVDNTALWRGDDLGKLPATNHEALKVAEQFLDDANRRTEAFNQATDAGLRTLLPDRSQRQLETCTLVMSPDESRFDHWLCRYGVQFSAGVGSPQSVPVLGMGIELRIGANGVIKGFLAQWRPIVRILHTELLSYEKFSFLLKDEDQPEDSDNPDAGKLLYPYDGAVGNQYYLAPHYYRAGDDHVQLSPASKYSLVVKILEEHTSEETRLTGQVYGGSGDYRFNWAAWNLESVWANAGGIVLLGEGEAEAENTETGRTVQSVIQIPKSYYTVMLNVTDQRSGAYGHFQRAVYSPPAESDDYAAV